MNVVEERAATAVEEPEEASEKQVAPLELFFDMLVLAALWWAWGAYAWLTNPIDTEQDTERLLTLGAVAAMLVADLVALVAFHWRTAQWLRRERRVAALVSLALIPVATDG